MASSDKVLSRAEVLALFGTLDPATVAAAFTAAATTLHLPEGSLPLPDVLRLLEHMASERGAVGVAARFAKARVLLQAAPKTRP